MAARTAQYITARTAPIRRRPGAPGPRSALQVRPHGQFVGHSVVQMRLDLIAPASGGRGGLLMLMSRRGSPRPARLHRALVPDPSSCLPDVASESATQHERHGAAERAPFGRPRGPGASSRGSPSGPVQPAARRPVTTSQVLSRSPAASSLCRFDRVYGSLGQVERTGAAVAQPGDGSSNRSVLVPRRAPPAGASRLPLSFGLHT